MLSTKLNVVADPSLLLVISAIVAALIFAKFSACWADALLSGRDNPTTLAISALVNARVLMESIIIAMRLQQGMIGVELCSILALMAAATTFMDSPLFEHVYGRQTRVRGQLGELVATDDAPCELASTASSKLAGW